ncbi:MAG: tetratricopeptide repeat protein [Cyanobacteria bacterium SZAS LIN-5]|nr:tetratricopeptide repeat protein [Cyanobacteria bacterium SZAS LIN-5]
MNRTNLKRINGLILAITIGISTALSSSALPSESGDVPANSDMWSSPVQRIPAAESNQLYKQPQKKELSKTETLDETYRKSGDMKLSDGDFTGALDEYDKALQVNSKNAMAYYGRGRVRLATSDYSEARIDLNKALTIDSNLTSARLALIGILMYTRDFASGISEATKVIESDPRNALAYYERGICNGEVGRRADAINDLSEAKSLLLADGDQVGCDFVNFSLGKQYQENGRYAAYQKDFETALKDFDAALSINSASAATLIAKASVEAEMGSKEAALADYNKAIEVAPLLADAYKQRGNYYMQTASYQLAQEDFTRALAIDPSDPELYNSRGRTYEALGNMDDANADYKQAQVVAKTQSKQETEQLTKTITDLVQKV